MELAFILPASAWVELDVFEAQGWLIASLFHGKQAAGLVNRNRTPTRELSTGLYFLQKHDGVQELARETGPGNIARHRSMAVESRAETALNNSNPVLSSA